MTEERIVVKNLKINYKTFGSPDGKPFLILHGWGSKSDTWQPVAELLAKENIKIIVPDLPGFGKSQEPESAWSLDNYVDWLDEFSEQVPGLQKGFYLLGHSFGGALAAKFSIEHNQKIEKLFLVAAAIVRQKTGTKETISYAAKLLKKFSFVPGYESLRKACYKFIVRSDYPSLSGVMKETYLKVISEDLSQKTFFIKVPTIIIWGDKDVLTPIGQAELISKKIEGSKLVVIPGGGHALQIKMPEALAEKILENI